MKYSEAIAEILLSNGEEYEQARKVIAGNLDNLAEVFGPRIRELSQFRTQLDIEAVQQMQAAGMIRAKPSCSGQAPTWRLQICQQVAKRPRMGPSSERGGSGLMMQPRTHRGKKIWNETESLKESASCCGCRARKIRMKRHWRLKECGGYYQEYDLTLEGIVDEETEKARQINRKTRKDLEEWAHILAKAVPADVLDCRSFHDPNTGETSFVGVGADPEVCGWMYGYLYKTLLRLASEHMRGPAAGSAAQSRNGKPANLFFSVPWASSVIGWPHRKRRRPLLHARWCRSRKGLFSRVPDDLKTNELHIGKLRDNDRLCGMIAAEGIPLERLHDL